MWFGNHDTYRDGPAPFRPRNGAPEVKVCGMGFHADIYGGYSEPCFGSRYHVLARRAPAWQKDILAWAAREERPLLARCIGSAGKYSFWIIEASSPDEARAQSERLAKELAAKELAEKKKVLGEHYALAEGECVVAGDGEVLAAVAAKIARGPAGVGEELVLLADGRVIKAEGLAIHDRNGHEVAPYKPRASRWLPSEPSSDHASVTWWEEALAEREAAEAAEREAQIERARAEKRARKAAKAAINAEDGQPSALASALAKARARS